MIWGYPYFWKHPSPSSSRPFEFDQSLAFPEQGKEWNSVSWPALFSPLANFQLKGMKNLAQFERLLVIPSHWTWSFWFWSNMIFLVWFFKGERPSAAIAALGSEWRSRHRYPRSVRFYETLSKYKSEGDMSTFQKPRSWWHPVFLHRTLLTSL